MKCKWLSDDFNEICTNAGCDCVADFCPCVNWPQICRNAELVEVNTDKRTKDMVCGNDYSKME
jgi:hypothetical protein